MPGEGERAFRARCQQAAREGRDAAVDKLRDKYEVQFAHIEQQLRREQQDLTDSEARYKGRRREELLADVATVAGVLGLLGRRTRSTRSLAAAATKRRLTGAAKDDIAEAQAGITQLEAQLDELKRQMQADAAHLTQQWAAAAADVQPLRITPRKTDVAVAAILLGWAPAWQVTYQDSAGQMRTELLPAFAPAGAA